MKYLLSALELLGRAKYDEAYQDCGDERYYPIMDELSELFESYHVKVELISPYFESEKDKTLEMVFEDSEIVKMSIFYKDEAKSYEQTMTLIVKPSYTGKVKIIEDHDNKSGRCDILRKYEKGLIKLEAWIKKGLKS